MAYTYDDAAKNLLAGKDCDHCINFINCKHPQLRKKFSTCPKWEEMVYGPESLLRIVRAVYPNTIKGELTTCSMMEKSKEQIYYLKPVYKEEDDKK